MIGNLDNYLRFNETALSLRSQRQELLASNIANADTPNYKARDVDFASALKGAMARKDGVPPALKGTAPQHMPGKGLAAGAGSSTGGKVDALADGTPLLYRGVVQGAVDGNTVDMDVERNQFTDNALRYEAGVMMINSQLKGLMTAIQGQ